METKEFGYEIICEIYPVRQPEPYLGDLKKHAEHDQSSHGSWAGGGSMPYQWKPKLKFEDSQVSDEFFEEGLDTLVKISESPVVKKVTASTLEKIVKDGRLKSLVELPLEDYLRRDEFLNYNERREELQTNIWKIPESQQIIHYGYIDTNYQNHEPQTSNYGSIKIIFRESVLERTTFNAGDTLATGNIPVLIKQAKTRNLSKAEVASTFVRSDNIAIKDFLKPQNVQFFEAQIHGSVSLKDIKTVMLANEFVSQETINVLRANGVKVIENE